MARKVLQKYLPHFHRVREHQTLRLFGSAALKDNLWHLNRRSVARAFAIGVFCAFLPIPGQMVAAAALAIVFASNLPLAVLLVWITNPVTIPPILSHRLLGRQLGAQHPPSAFRVRVVLGLVYRGVIRRRFAFARRISDLRRHRRGHQLLDYPFVLAVVCGPYLANPAQAQGRKSPARHPGEVGRMTSTCSTGVHVAPGARSAPRNRLLRLARSLRQCSSCAEDFELHGHAPRPVARLSTTARICVSGQAPGTHVHRSGLPFNDPSGKRLREWMGVDLDQFYDTKRIVTMPMAFCFPRARPPWGGFATPADLQ